MAKDLPQLKKYLDNENVQWFIYNILKKESDKTSDGKINTGGFNQNAGNSSAFGAGQFIGTTRNNILNQYNVDAWSPDLEEQKLAIVALLDNVGQLEEITKGDFSSQYDPKKGQWEAFHNKEGSLDKKPNKWETEYTTLSDTAVFRPDESWSKIPEDIRVEKENLFQNKYQGLPTEIINPIDGVLDNTAQALGLPTSQELQDKLFQYESLKAYDDLVAKGERDPYIVNQDYDLGTSLADQFLSKNSDLAAYLNGSDTTAANDSSNSNRGTQGSSITDPNTDLQAIYEMLLASDKATEEGNGVYNLVNQDFEQGPQAPQFLAKRMQKGEEFSNLPTTSSIGSNVTDGPTSTGTGTTGRASGYEGMSAEDLQNIYQGLLEADAAAAAGDGVYPLISQEFEPGPQAPQFLARRMQGSTPSGSANSNSAESSTMSSSDLEQLRNMMQGERTPSMSSEIDYQKEFKNATPDSVDRNLLAKLKGQDYTGLLTDIGAYAARMAPLSRAMREASSYDEERYPRFAPIVPTATLPKRDVRDAFATAQQAALQQGRLDLGALSALATQQAKETARVEESVANERVALLNQAQQLNNQITMQEMADTAANKGAAQTMQYQVLAAMSEMGQGSLREANMRRNDQIVKNMFSNVFGDEFA